MECFEKDESPIVGFNIKPGEELTLTFYSTLGATTVLVNACRADFYEQARAGETATQAANAGQDALDSGYVEGRVGVGAWQDIAGFANAIDIGAIVAGSRSGEFSIRLSSSAEECYIALVARVEELSSQASYTGLVIPAENETPLLDDLITAVALGSGGWEADILIEVLGCLRTILLKINPSANYGTFLASVPKILSLWEVGPFSHWDADSLTELIDLLNSYSTSLAVTITTTELDALLAATPGGVWTQASLTELRQIIDDLIAA